MMQTNTSTQSYSENNNSLSVCIYFTGQFLTLTHSPDIIPKGFREKPLRIVGQDFLMGHSQPTMMLFTLHWGQETQSLRYIYQYATKPISGPGCDKLKIISIQPRERMHVARN